jgi:hypothetical protein
MLAWCAAPLELTEETKSGTQRACIRPRCIGATRAQTNLHLQRKDNQYQTYTTTTTQKGGEIL